MMNLIALLTTTVLSFLTNVSSQAVPRLDGRIVGGRNASITDYPHQLALYNNDTYFCCASIISARWAVTSAHCMEGVGNHLSVRAGSSNNQEGGTLYKVDKKIVHNRYNGKTMDYDIALLRVRTRFVFGPGVAAIKLSPYGQEPSEGTIGAVTGWGRLSDGGTLPSTLQVVELPIVTRAACRIVQKDHKITARMICAGSIKGGKDACEGDSGGPLVVNGKLVGIVSWGSHCTEGQNKPGVYSNISNLIRWIAQMSGVTTS